MNSKNQTGWTKVMYERLNIDRMSDSTKKILGKQSYHFAVPSDSQNKSMNLYTLLSMLLFLCNK